MSQVMGIYVKFTMTTHQIWSCDVTLASNSEHFYFLSNSVLIFGNFFFQIWGKLAQEQKSYRQKTKLGAKNTPLPSAYRVKVNCKFQNKSGLYFGYFDFFSESVSKLEFKKSLIQVYIIPNFKSIGSF